MTFPLIDAHQDLAWNILTFGRDYTRSAHQTRELEHQNNSIAPWVNGDTLLGWPEYLQGGVVLIFATLFVAPYRSRPAAWEVAVYGTPYGANRLNLRQWDIYRRLVEQHPDKFRLITTRPQFQELWETALPRLQEPRPVGLVLLMENAEGIRNAKDLALWYQRGLRIIGPAWAGTRFCGGTGEPGPLTDEGRWLLREMATWNYGLDISHMDEPAALEALDTYPGVVLASHANPKRALGDEGNRHLDDHVIRRLAERDGVMGIVPYNRFLDVNWRKGRPKDTVPLRRVAEFIDYVCQLTGSARHVALGSDFDGGFGVQHVPKEIDTIADLQRLAPLLEAMGYREDDIRAIFADNWRRILLNLLPEDEPQ